MKVLLYPPLSDYVVDLAYSLVPPGIDLERIADDASEDELIGAIERADVLVGIVGKPPSPRVFQAMGGLKLIQVLTAGHNAIDVDAARQMGVPVAINGGANAVAVAEHTIMLMLAIYKDLANLSARAKSGSWRADQPGDQEFHEMAGKTIGVVGLGNIGREVARRLRTWEVTVLYYKPTRAPVEIEEELGVTYAALPQLLQSVDILTLHIPLTAQTRHLIGRRELAMMKRSAVLINTCRGAVVDTGALYEALRDGVIAGAGLDTIDPEPPPPDLALLSLPNVTCTPHVAGHSTENWPKRVINAFANVQRIAAGDPPLWLVNSIVAWPSQTRR